MESLESRMERLTPAQRMEVEDFVDFLLLKNNFRQNPPAVPSPAPILMNAPPVLSAEPVPAVPAMQMSPPLIHEEPHLTEGSYDPEPSSIQEIAGSCEDGYMDYGMYEQAAIPAAIPEKSTKRKVIAREAEEKSRHLLEWVD
ncbi:hypothetical protein [Methanoregula sp.]|uniref:hypothetical protein n=1 Tax=Methanoregula sp. TaxID=2052170 RepID=UPI002610601A|nr:hypothetical protein [Methanoregula sp.]MDD5143260.1 hypothetical protein [Methanoregula sp.]